MNFILGEVAPWFVGTTLKGITDFRFDSVGGRHVLLLIVGSAGGEAAQAAIRAVEANRDLFDDKKAMFFGVTRDPEDAATGRIQHLIPGIRWFLDHDGAISRLYRAVGPEGEDRAGWLLLDPMLRTAAVAGLNRTEEMMAAVRGTLAGPRAEIPAPVLILPNVFEPAFCRHLISIYEREGGVASGFMREVGGKTTGILDERFKRRSDVTVRHEGLREQIQERLSRNLAPMIERSMNFRLTRIERYLIACYDGDEGGGFFRPHRDNTTTGTAHRRFACTINLNAEDYEGGDLLFPEFGTRQYRAPTGGAVVFSCSLLHEARPVRRGKRYAFLPFFYDEAAARQREANAGSGKVDSQYAEYKA